MGEIVLKEIKMTLDPESIQNAIDEVTDLNLNLRYAMDCLCEWLLKQGVMIARMQLRGYLGKHGKPSKGNLYRSIRYEMANGKSGEGYLMAGYPGDHQSDNPQYANVSYAVFFEFGFGTGSYYYKQSQGGGLMKTQASIDRNLSVGNFDASRTRGRTKSHPSGKGHYRDAEEYQIRQSNQGEFFGWVYKNKMDGKFYISEGQPPKPFMYNTYMELLEKAQKDGPRIIAEYLP